MAKHAGKGLKSDVKYYHLVVILIAFLAMVICFWIGMRQSVWFDEAYSISVAKQSVGQVISLTAADTHPPFYYLLLKAWGSVFGWSEAALRSMSVVAYGASIVAAAALVRRMFGARAAILSAIFLLFAPLLMRYGFEIRMYSFASLIGVLATYVMVRARMATNQLSAKRLWVLYGLLVAIGTYTLYYTVMLWLAHLVWLVVTERTNLRSIWRQPYMLAYAGAVGLFLPWIPSFTKQLTNGALASIGQPMNLEQLIGVVSFNFLYKPLWQVNVLDSIAMLAVITVGLYVIGRALRVTTHKKSLLLLICYIVVPVAILAVVSIIRPMYVERYLSHVAIGLLLLVAVSVWIVSTHTPSSKNRAVLGLFLLTLVIGTMNLFAAGNFNFQRLQKPNPKQAVAEISDCQTATILAADPYVATEITYYLPNDCTVKFYSETKDLAGGYAPYANNPNRIGITVPMLTNKFYYVYYTDPGLVMDDNYYKAGETKYNDLTVATYAVK